MSFQLETRLQHLQYLYFCSRYHLRFVFSKVLVKLSNNYSLQRPQMQITQSLINCLSLNSIYKQLSIMRALTPKLSLSLEVLTQQETFRKLPLQQLIQSINQIPFISLNERTNLSPKDTLHLSYPNLQRTIFVSGFSSQLLSETLDSFALSFKKLAQKLQVKGALVTISARNDCWVTILCAHQQITSHLQRFLRVKKKQEQGKRILQKSKQMSDKVRIVKGDQDLFQFLIEMMVEYKSKLFHQSIRGGSLATSSTIKVGGGSRMSLNNTPTIFYKLMFHNNGPQNKAKGERKQNNQQYNLLNQQCQKTSLKQIQQSSSSQYNNKVQKVASEKHLEQRVQPYFDSTSESSEQNYVIDTCKEQDFALGAQLSKKKIQLIYEHQQHHNNNKSDAKLQVSKEF